MAKTEKTIEQKKFIPPYIPLTRRELEVILGFSRATIYRILKVGTPYYDPSFPRPLQFGAGKVVWRADEIETWMLTRERTVNIENDDDL